MGVKRTQAKTLVQTEAAAITMKAQQGCFQELEIEEYEIEETLDSFTCSFCGEMDGKHFTMSETDPCGYEAAVGGSGHGKIIAIVSGQAKYQLDS